MKRSFIKKTLCLFLSLLLGASVLPGAGLVPAAEAAYTVSDAYRNSPYYAAVNAVQLTGEARADLLNVARSQLGYIEGGEAGDFGGSGSTGVRDNYTEYLYWYFGDATAHGDNYAWCAAFVSWCANRAGISTETIPRFARVQSEGQATFESWGRFRSGAYIPAPGDLIFYGSANYSSHTAVYIGNHKVVHAANTRMGIIITDIDWCPGRVKNRAMRYWA